MTTEQAKENITGLDNARNRKDAEYDLTKALLEASEYKEAEDNISIVDVKRAGKLLFTVHLHPLSDTDLKLARKKATAFAPNPQGKKFPPIEKEFDNAKFKSWLIYLATTEEDQEKIWGNGAIMKKFGLMQPVESIDHLLTAGEKSKMTDEIVTISGFDDEEEAVTEEDFR